MNGIEEPSLGFVLLVIAMVSVVAFFMLKQNPGNIVMIISGDKACKEIGYEEYIFLDSDNQFALCKDNNSDFHIVEVTLKSGLGIGIDKVIEIDENEFWRRRSER